MRLKKAITFICALLTVAACDPPPPDPPPPNTPDPFLYALGPSGGQTRFVAISTTGVASPTVVLGSNFEGGLAYHAAGKRYYAVSLLPSGTSALHEVDGAGVAKKIGDLSARVTGGIAYRYADKQLYAVTVGSGGNSLLNRLSTNGTLTPLFEIGMNVAGLAHDPVTGRFFAITVAPSGFSKLWEVTLDGSVRERFGLGKDFRGGLAYHPGNRRFYAIAAGKLHTISLEGAVDEWTTVGSGFEGAALTPASGVPGAGIWIYLPVADARVVSGESTPFDASVSLVSSSLGHEFPDGQELTWTSNLSGALGQGSRFTSSALGVGNHTITVTGHDMSSTRAVRVFADLQQLYASPPARAELSYVEHNFDIRWIDSATEKWSDFEGDPFDTTSLRPSKLAALAPFYLLSVQRFTKPIPLLEPGQRTLFDHLRAHTRILEFGLHADSNAAARGTMYLNREFSAWATAGITDPQSIPVPYVTRAGLLIHEGQHNRPGDPGHSSCGGGPLWSGLTPVHNAQDETFENGSGYAVAAIYFMWVYKYGTDSQFIKNRAKSEAATLLRSRFCKKPSHSNPDIQAILDELL
jgi:hypothetical protein